MAGSCLSERRRRRRKQQLTDGDKATTSIKVPNERGNRVFQLESMCRGDLFSLTSKRIEDVTVKLFGDEEVDGVTVTDVPEGDSTVTTFDFDTQTDHRVNGMFTNTIPLGVRVGSPLFTLQEVFIFIAHEKFNKGPFPNLFTQAGFETRRGRTCKADEPCYVSCTSYANDMDSVQIFRVDKFNTYHPIPTQTSDIFYKTTARGLVAQKGQDAIPGTYVCRAVHKDPLVYRYAEDKIQVTVDTQSVLASLSVSR